MTRKLISGLVFSSVLALAAGCNSQPQDLPKTDAGRDFSEYSRNGRAAQLGYGDPVGSAIVARDEPGSYAKALPASQRRAMPKPVVKPVEPVMPDTDIATTPQE